MLHLFAAVVLGLLVAIGWGVLRIFKDTSFMASIVSHNLDQMDEAQAAQVLEQPRDDDETETRPVGFGVRLIERD